ncbi:MAG: YggS family pyridoxal phosphate-dependent enzyme [Gemmatimonadaceae bacterium]
MNGSNNDGFLAEHDGEQRESYVAFVADRVHEVRQRIEHSRQRSAWGQSVTLVAVTKTHNSSAVEAAWQAGVVDVGENKVQEAEEKMDAVSVPVRWHLIGHLQRNKARSAVRFDLVHSIDSERLAKAVNDAAVGVERLQDVLIQVNVSGEETKGGFSMNDVSAFAARLHVFRNLRVVGAMTMAPFDATEAELRTIFGGARRVRDELAKEGHPASELSMGMSGDFEIAVEEGATLVRLGTVLFGNRAST